MKLFVQILVYFGFVCHGVSLKPMLCSGQWQAYNRCMVNELKKTKDLRVGLGIAGGFIERNRVTDHVSKCFKQNKCTFPLTTGDLNKKIGRCFKKSHNELFKTLKQCVRKKLFLFPLPDDQYSWTEAEGIGYLHALFAIRHPTNYCPANTNLRKLATCVAKYGGKSSNVSVTDDNAFCDQRKRCKMLSFLNQSCIADWSDKVCGCIPDSVSKIESQYITCLRQAGVATNQSRDLPQKWLRPAIGGWCKAETPSWSPDNVHCTNDTRDPGRSTSGKQRSTLAPERSTRHQELSTRSQGRSSSTRRPRTSVSAKREVTKNRVATTKNRVTSTSRRPANRRDMRINPANVTANVRLAITITPPTPTERRQRKEQLASWALSESESEKETLQPLLNDDPLSQVKDGQATFPESSVTKLTIVGEQTSDSSTFEVGLTSKAEEKSTTEILFNLGFNNNNNHDEETSQTETNDDQSTTPYVFFFEKFPFNQQGDNDDQEKVDDELSTTAAPQIDPPNGIRLLDKFGVGNPMNGVLGQILDVRALTPQSLVKQIFKEEAVCFVFPKLCQQDVSNQQSSIFIQ